MFPLSSTIGLVRTRQGPPDPTPLVGNVKRRDVHRGPSAKESAVRKRGVTHRMPKSSGCVAEAQRLPLDRGQVRTPRLICEQRSPDIGLPSSRRFSAVPTHRLLLPFDGHDIDHTRDLRPQPLHDLRAREAIDNNPEEQGHTIFCARKDHGQLHASDL